MKSRDELKEIGTAVLTAGLDGGWLASILVMVVLFGEVAVRGFEVGDPWMVFCGICFALVSVANGWLVLGHLRRGGRS